MMPGRRSPQRGRRHVTTACSECRITKLKCDGEQPQCGRCKLRNKECSYRSRNDKRRIPHQRKLEVLRTRVIQLESFIASSGLLVPEVHDDDYMVYKDVALTSETSIRTNHDIPAFDKGSPAELDEPLSKDSTGTLVSPSNFHSDTDYEAACIIGLMEDGGVSYQAHRPAAVSNENLDNWVVNILNVADSQTFSAEDDSFQVLSFDSDNLARAQQVPSPWNEIEQPNPAIPGSRSEVASARVSDELKTAPSYHEFSENDEELLLQLSNRMGDLHLTNNGMSRFYGATSNFNFARWNSSLDLNLHQTAMEQPALEHTRPDEASLLIETTLEELYFCWQDSAFHAIDQDMYQYSKKLWRDHQQSSTFYSPLLTNAICTFGSLFYEPRGSAAQLAKTYERKSKALLELELDCPKVATVQALITLSTFEASRNRDARGWLYAGMAMRLAFDLGLHVDTSHYISLGDMTRKEAKSRGIAFWGCYVVDHLWGFYLGRPFHTNADNITVEKPWSDNSKLLSVWKPCRGSQTDLLGSRRLNLPDFTELISQKWVSLSGLMDGLSNVMYGCEAASQDDLLLVADSTLAELVQWKNSLPPELQIDVDDTTAEHLPHLILLHMQYYQIIVYIHRPFLYSRSTMTASSSGKHFNQPRAVCIDAAIAIAKLINNYKQTYTLRRINIQAVSVVFSASLLLLFASLSVIQDDDGSDYIAHLDVCAHALAEMGGYYENSARSLDLLLSIKRDWKAHLVSGGSLLRKRRRSIQSDEVISPQKHVKIQSDAGAGSGDGVVSGNIVGEIDISEDLMFALQPLNSVDWPCAMGRYHNGAPGAETS